MMLIVSAAILFAVAATPASAKSLLIEDLGLPSTSTEQVPEGTPDVGPVTPPASLPQIGIVPGQAPGVSEPLAPQSPQFGPTMSPPYSPQLGSPDRWPQPIRITPALSVGPDEVGIYNASQFTLAFLLGDPPAQVKLDPHQIKVVSAMTGSAVRVQIKTGSGEFSAYDLSAGAVYAIVFSSGAWTFAKY
jgi:hypothetical protein